jgi:hypothetical protein
MDLKGNGNAYLGIKRVWEGRRRTRAGSNYCVDCFFGGTCWLDNNFWLACPKGSLSGCLDYADEPNPKMERRLTLAAACWGQR